jgi:hypothetical protein
MMKLKLLGLFFLFSFFHYTCLSQYKSFESLSLFVPNISERGQLLASVNVPFFSSEIGVAYAPFNNIVVHSFTHFGSMSNRATEFTQTGGIGLTKRAGKYFMFGIRGFGGYHKYFFQDPKAPFSDLPVYHPAVISNNRLTFYNYYQYNSGSVQADITIETKSAQFTFAAALTRLHYTYLRMFPSGEIGKEERYDFYETHVTVDFGARLFLDDNIALLANFGLRSLVTDTSPKKDRLTLQTLELPYANIGALIILNTRQNKEKQKSE